MRFDQRQNFEPRPCTIQTGFVETAAGSCLISTGKTRVICTASVEEGVPPFLRGQNRGWVPGKADGKLRKDNRQVLYPAGK